MTQRERPVSLTRLAMYGLLTLLVSIPLVIGACLLHNRVREEEEFEDDLVQQRLRREPEISPPEYAGGGVKRSPS